MTITIDGDLILWLLRGMAIYYALTVAVALLIGFFDQSRHQWSPRPPGSPSAKDTERAWQATIQRQEAQRG